MRVSHLHVLALSAFRISCFLMFNFADYYFAAILKPFGSFVVPLLSSIEPIHLSQPWIALLLVLLSVL